MSADGSLQTLLQVLRSRQLRLTWAGGVTVASVCTAALAALWFFIADDFLALKWQQAIPVLPVFLLILAGWYLWREAYLRSGSGRRIGVYFESVLAPHGEIREAQRRFEELALQRSGSVPISVRAVPARRIKTEEDILKFQRRYKFDVIVAVEVSSHVKDRSRPSFHIKLAPQVRKQLDKDFAAASAQHLAQILGRGPRAESASQLLRLTGEKVYDLLLAVLAVTAYVEDSFDDGADFCERLDKRLAPHFATGQHPRLAFRWLMKQCLMVRSVFPGAAPPGPEVLDLAIRKGAQAFDLLGLQFPEVPTMQARNLFYKGEVDAALALIDRVAAIDLDPYWRAVVLLDQALLHLVSCNWQKAATYYGQFLAHPQADKLDWHDLVGFADMARAMGYEQAQFAQCLYRKGIPSETVGAEREAEMLSWLRQDQSRNALLVLYHRAPRFKRQGKVPVSAQASKPIRASGKRRRRR